MKPSGHVQSLLRTALFAADWEIVDVDTDTGFWWCPERWTIRSTREQAGYALTLSFLPEVGHDPPLWWELMATRGPLRERAQKASAIACSSLAMDERGMMRFVAELTRYRRGDD